MNTPVNGLPPCYQFGDLTLDAGRRSVTRRGRAIELSGLNFDLLRILVEASPAVVSHDDLAEKVWGRHFVSPENIAQRVALLRHSLSDDANEPRYIETVRGKGYRLIPSVSELAAGHDGVKRRRFMWVAASAATFIALIATGIYLADTPPPARPAAQPNSVAILPLNNLSPDPEHAYFAAGFHEELVGQLAKVPSISVIAQASARLYTDDERSIREIAEELNVETVMRGSVRFTDDRVRVTATLIDAATGASSWSDVYEGPLSDVFAIQEDMALNITAALGAEFAKTSRQGTTSAIAAELYYRAVNMGIVDGNVDGARQLTYLSQALEFDPEFADAFAARAQVRAITVVDRAETAGGRADDSAVEAVEQLALADARKALQLDRNSVRAYLAMATVDRFYWRWSSALRSSKTAYELNPNDISAIGNYAELLSWTGDHDEAIRLRQRAVQLDPVTVGARWGLGIALTQARQADAAAATLSEAAAMAPAASPIRHWLGQAQAMLGNDEAALAELRTAEQLMQGAAPNPTITAGLMYSYSRVGRQEDVVRLFAELEKMAADGPVGSGTWALAHLARGDSDEALRWLRLTIEKIENHEPDAGYLNLMTIKTDLHADPILDEPRFRELREKIGALN